MRRGVHWDRRGFGWRGGAAALVLLAGGRPVSFAAEDKPLAHFAGAADVANPHAPAALSRFAFLVGQWRCTARLKTASGSWQHFQASWTGHFILDGYAIADEYRMVDASGAVIVLGMNVRTYDAAAGMWNIKWLNALTGSWTDLVPSSAGKLTMDDHIISYPFKEPAAIHAYTRATYTNESQEHFTWRGDQSEDAKTWSEFMVIACDRIPTDTP